MLAVKPRLAFWALNEVTMTCEGSEVVLFTGKEAQGNRVLFGLSFGFRLFQAFAKRSGHLAETYCLLYV